MDFYELGYCDEKRLCKSCICVDIKINLYSHITRREKVEKYQKNMECLMYFLDNLTFPESSNMYFNKVIDVKNLNIK